jgi:hypothetical protein
MGETSRVSHVRGLRLLFPAAVLLSLITITLQAQEPAPPGPPVVTSSINWQTSTLEITLEQEADLAAGNTPARLHRAQQHIEREFASQLFDSLLPLQIDSTRTVEDAVRRQPGLAARLSALAERADRGLPRPTPDLTAITRQYRVPIFPDLAELFIGHRIPFRMERVLDWVPTREFSGIVIFAADRLPHRGTGREVFLTPALLPEVFDTDLRPILEQDMLDPESIRRWGVVAYTESFDEDSWRNRIGADPLRIMAREAFGVSPTDIVIGREDADRILVSDHNRRLLREGRILVIVAPGQTTAR